MKKYHIIEKDDYNLIVNDGGKTLGYSPLSGIDILEVDGYAFKDLNRNGKLDPYEDWRLDDEERIKDLVSQMSIEDIAGLMLYSGHQSIKTPGDDLFALRFAGTYGGKSFHESDADITDLTDQQKTFLKDDKLRHVLITSVDSPEVAARWTNHVQAFVEGIDLGIPANNSSDPRHGSSSNGEYEVGAGGAISQWPSQLGLAATFDPDLVEEFGQIASKEYRALGIATALSPQIDLATEPRWSRFHGTFGEGTKLSVDMARAYVDGFQTTEDSENGWGQDSVNAMIKHWPGGGAGEGGRDAHFAYGKYSVFPGDNLSEALLPFTEGALKLNGRTEMASAVMPYYTISYNQDIKYGENVGNSYSKYIIRDLLRGHYGFDGVICTDWGITKDNPKVDSFGTTSWGVEHLNVNERHYKAIMAGVDQFGGNNEAAPIIAAYKMGCASQGEEAMTSRMQQSAARLLRNIFHTGLFENPYCDVEHTKETVGNPEYMKKGYEAQLKSMVMLKNKNHILPLDRCKVYVPDRHYAPTKTMFGGDVPARDEAAIDSAILSKYFDVVDTPEEADVAIVLMDSPQSSGYIDGYLPISLQYRPYTATTAREFSIAGGDPYEDSKNRSYKGKTNYTVNECDLDILLDTKEKMGDKPVITILNLKNPTVVGEFEDKVDAILVNFQSSNQAALDIITGKYEPSGLLPCQMPKNMETVEANYEDVPRDMECYQDEEGHTYEFGYGLNFNGVIDDERCRKYKE